MTRTANNIYDDLVDEALLEDRLAAAARDSVCKRTVKDTTAFFKMAMQWTQEQADLFQHKLTQRFPKGHADPQEIKEAGRELCKQDIFQLVRRAT